MKAEPEGLIDLMFDNKRQYQIPVYQRNYDWGKENCQVLFNDILTSYNKSKSHFLGTVVQVQQDEENGIKRFIIIDGQQRMTSIYLLLKAMYDLSEKDSGIHENLEELLFNMSSSKDFSKDEKNKLKLKPIKSDNEQFTLLMSDNIDKMDKSSNIFINYNFFKQLIKKAIDSEDIKVQNIKKGLEYLKIIMISLKEPEDEPQVIFERINSTGEDLKLADLIRNYLLMTDANMEQLFEEYWLPVENLVGRDSINDYFMNYLYFKLPEVTDKNAYQQFKKYADQHSHSEILQEVKKYSIYYNAFVRNDTNYSHAVNSLLNCYRILKQTTIYPFFFSVFSDFEDGLISEKTLLDILLFFVNYTLRRSITGVGTNSLRGLYRTLYKRIFADGIINDEIYKKKIYEFMATIPSTKDVVPNDTIFKERLMTENLYKNRNVCKFLLSILENGISYVKEQVVIGDNISIEHIMPQNDKNVVWQNEIGINYKAVYDKYVHTLGNLTLTGYNSELSDKSFHEKVKYIRQKSKFIYLNVDVVDKEHWNESTIQERANRLSDKLLQEFSLPDEFKIVNLDHLSGTIKYSLDDDCDLVKNKILSFVLLNEKFVVSSMADLLVKTCEILYKNNADSFENMARKDYKLEGSEKPLFSYDASLLRNAKEIMETGIYVETNKSSKDIILTIKKLLDEFGVMHDDFVYYVLGEM